jgi:hypothetical protein
LSHLRFLCVSYDEPKILSSQLNQFCLMGADVGQSACKTNILNISTDGKAGRPPFNPSDRFSAFANGFSNTGQGMMLLSFSRGSPTALRRL